MEIQVYFKGGNIIQNLLVAPEGKYNITQKSRAIYSYKCGQLECNEGYIGESARTFEERLKENVRSPSPIYDHANIKNPHTSVNSFPIVGRESHNLARTIKEAMYITVNDSSLNRNMWQ